MMVRAILSPKDFLSALSRLNVFPSFLVLKAISNWADRRRYQNSNVLVGKCQRMRWNEAEFE